VKVLVVVEDDPDVQFLVETIFSMDCRLPSLAWWRRPKMASRWRERHNQGSSCSITACPDN